MDYCSGIWGYQNFGKLNTIHNRAQRLYLGVHRFAPNLAINGDMGWVNSNTRRKIEMLRLWNRLIKMDNSRLTKKIFLWDKDKNVRNWSNEVLKLLTDIGLEQNFYQSALADLDYCKDILFSSDKELWCQQVTNVPKLRTYIVYKTLYDVEPYVYRVLHRGHRSILAQFRTGILPLAIETGRYNDTPPENRFCILCNENLVEDESHFLFQCKLYEDERQILFEEAEKGDKNFAIKGVQEKLNILMSTECIKQTAKFLYTCYFKRRNVLYN